MKLTDLHEMTLKVNDLESQLKFYYDYLVSVYENNPEKFKHIGDFSFNVKALIYEDDGKHLICPFENELLGFLQTEFVNSSMRTFQNFYIIPKARGQKLLVQLGFFIKKYFGCQYLKMGDVHSATTVSIINQFTKTERFKVHYMNKQGELHPFDSDVVYSLTNKTGNVIVLECILSMDVLKESALFANFETINDIFDGKMYPGVDWLL